MPVRKKEQILAFTVHFKWFGLVFHYLAIEGHEVFHAAQRAAGVAALAIVNKPHYVATHLCSLFLELVKFCHYICFNVKVPVGGSKVVKYVQVLA